MGDARRADAIDGRMTAEQVADLIRDDAWRASSQRLDDALGWPAGGSKRFARGSSSSVADGTRGPSPASER